MANAFLLRPLALVVVLSVALGVFLTTRDEPGADDAASLPSSMAALGDSITQALAVDEETLGVAPEHSWATGTSADDGVDSHAERLLAAGALSEGIYNNSLPGAKVADVIAQAEAAVSQEAEYVLILIGANDVCAPDAASMTSPDAFRASFTEAMRVLSAGLPRSDLYVVSIPNVNRLWEVARDNFVAQTIWDTVGICQSVLSASLSDDARQAAADRNVEFNRILEEVCLATPRCRFDGGAVFEVEFSEEEVGPRDYFHPSLEGQATLADISWEHGYWPDL